MTEDAVAAIVAGWREERPDEDADPMLVVGRIFRLAQVMDAALRPPFAEAGLGNGEFDILAALRRAGRPYARTPRELQRAMMVTSGAITKQVDRLERKGLVTRGPDPRDGRSRTVALTSAGRRLVDRLLPVHLANERGLLSALSVREQDQLASLLGRLAADLEARPGGDD